MDTRDDDINQADGDDTINEVAAAAVTPTGDANQGGGDDINQADGDDTINEVAAAVTPTGDANQGGGDDINQADGDDTINEVAAAVTPTGDANQGGGDNTTTEAAAAGTNAAPSSPLRDLLTFLGRDSGAVPEGIIANDDNAQIRITLKNVPYRLEAANRPDTAITVNDDNSSTAAPPLLDNVFISRFNNESFTDPLPPHLTSPPTNMFANLGKMSLADIAEQASKSAGKFGSKFGGTGGPPVPPSNVVVPSEAARNGSLSFLATIFLTTIDKSGGLAGGSLLTYATVPMGVTITNLYNDPSGPFNQPWNILCGHIIGSLMGIAAYNCTTNETSLKPLAIILSTIVMKLLKVYHPPATGTAVLMTQFASIESVGNLVGKTIASTLIILVTTLFLANVFSRFKYPRTWQWLGIDRNEARKAADLIKQQARRAEAEAKKGISKYVAYFREDIKTFIAEQTHDIKKGVADLAKNCINDAKAMLSFE